MLREITHRLRMTARVTRAQWRSGQCTRACSESHTYTVGCVLRPPVQMDGPMPPPERVEHAAKSAAEAPPTDLPQQSFQEFLEGVLRRAQEFHELHGPPPNLRTGLASELLVQSDSLLTLILHRESNGLSRETKEEIAELVFRIREWF